MIVEDRKNSALLFIGNDKGIFFSLDDGKFWNPLRGNMPEVPVKDLLIQPRENDLIAGSYGRGMWITPINVLQQMHPEVLKKDLWLFDIQSKPVKNYAQSAFWGNNRLMGDRHIFTPNEPNGLRLNYYLGKTRQQPVVFKIYNASGKQVAKIKGENAKGLHHVQWDTRNQKPGKYRVLLISGNDTLVKQAQVEPAYVFSVLNYHPKIK